MDESPSGPLTVLFPDQVIGQRKHDQYSHTGMPKLWPHEATYVTALLLLWSKHHAVPRHSKTGYFMSGLLSL